MTSSPGSRTPRGSRAATLLLGAALAAPLAAEPWIPGGQAVLAFPQSDLNGGHWLHGTTGAGFGLHLLKPLDGGHAFRLRGDAAWLPRGTLNLRQGAAGQESAKAGLYSAGIDYNFFPAVHPEGPYLIAGLGYSWIRCTGATAAVAGPWPSSQRASAPALAMGMGYRSTPLLGVEFRFTQATYKNLGSPGSRMQAPVLSAALTLDF